MSAVCPSFMLRTFSQLSGLSILSGLLQQPHVRLPKTYSFFHFQFADSAPKGCPSAVRIGVTLGVFLLKGGHPLGQSNYPACGGNTIMADKVAALLNGVDQRVIGKLNVGAEAPFAGYDLRVGW